MSDKEYPNTHSLESPTGDFHSHQFMVKQMLSRVSKAMMVQVTKVSTKGKVEGVGNVAVTPLVKMQDALGNTHAHGVMNNLPYYRMQGGKDKAIIMDPKVGDIGIAIFADRDHATVIKKNQGWDGTKQPKDTQQPPGSFRQHDAADGMYFGCFLGGKPTCYIDFTDDNKIVSSPDDGHTVVTLEKDKITLSAKDGNSTVVVQPTKIKAMVGSTPVVIQSGRVDLGDDPAPLGVMLDGGIVSTIVFGKP